MDATKHTSDLDATDLIYERNRRKTKTVTKSKQWYQAVLIKKCMEHCVKSVQMRSFFWSVFSCIRTEYGNIRVQFKYRKIRTRNNSVFGHFSRSGIERLSALLYLAPSKTFDEFNLNSYEMFINEPLQEISNHTPSQHIT